MPGPTALFQVDAFTREPFRGNPAAVCILDSPREDAWLQAVAREMNLSETAFLERLEDRWSLRWFTPATEVDLCGHATLASAHTLWEQGYSEPSAELRFATRSGALAARREGAGIILDFPAQPAAPEPVDTGLLDALGVAEAVAFARNRFDCLVQLADARAVRAVSPDMSRLARVRARGIIVTAPADDAGHDFVSRFFAPRVGVPEDPVTGSAHCCLGPWWAGILGRAELRGAQLSERGGSVTVRMRGDRVDLVGEAVTVLRGELIA